MFFPECATNAAPNEAFAMLIPLAIVGLMFVAVIGIFFPFPWRAGRHE